MRDRSTTNTATRLITLIMLLQRRPNQSAAQLARELGVSVRTIQRYMTMLDEMGIPIYAEHGAHGGYSLVRGYKMAPLVFSPEEAVAVYLGTSLLNEVWGPLYQGAARAALAKLDNVLPAEQRREVEWAQRTLLASGIRWADPEHSAPYLEKLRDGARKRQRVRMTYRGQGQPEPMQRVVDPYVLAHVWGWQYCIGYCHLRQGIRSFRVDRILDVELLDEHFDEPVEFDLQSYLASDPFFQPKVRARLRFAPESALAALDNRALWQSVEEQPDGSVIATFTMLDLEMAARFVLSYGYPGVVVEPDELRELVRERATAVAMQHEPPRDPEPTNRL